MSPFGLGEALSDCEVELVEIKAERDRAAEAVEDSTNRLVLAGHRIEGPHDCFAMNCKDLGPEVERLHLALREAALLPAPDALRAADRALAVPHRNDDQPCGCDDCMDYAAEDEGADWYRLTPGRRIVLRVLDSGDDRLAEIALAVRDHQAAPSPLSRADLETIEAEASAVHDYIWQTGSPDTPPLSQEAASAAIWSIHNLVRAAFRAAAAPDPRPDDASITRERNDA